jgi:Sortilin, neurotensin receptor 3,/Sortilin, neurotensin receptor 3, C-terminal
MVSISYHSPLTLGHTWKPLKCGDDHLHLHSESETHNTGNVFSSHAPGVLMGVGNTGDQLKPYDECDFYTSTDAGLTWSKARDGPYQYEFGDQGGVLVAVHDIVDTSSIWYSFNYGKDWEEMSLGDVKIKPVILTTTADSTTEKFTLVGKKQEGYAVFSLNFEGTRDRKCELKKNDDGGDFEKWYARYDDDGNTLVSKINNR